MTQRTWKQPSEARWFTYDFSELLQGRTISTIVGTPASLERGGVSTLTQVGVPIVAPTAVQVEWSGGNERRHLSNNRQGHGRPERTARTGRRNFGRGRQLRPAAEHFDRLPDGGRICGPLRLRRDCPADGPRPDRDHQRRDAAEALDDATELVSSYLGVRYTLPLSPVPNWSRDWWPTWRANGSIRSARPPQ
jgi:hypothetical protein